jgi:O-antigen/teichoic acid export membrane protein
MTLGKGFFQSSQAFRHGVVWAFLGNTGSRVLGFIIGVVLARLLSPEVFGAAATIQLFTGLAGFVAGGGMGQALVRAKEVADNDLAIVLTLQLVIGFLIFLFFYLIAPKFAQWYEAPLYEDLMKVSALVFLIRPFANVPQSIMHRHMQFKQLTVVDMTMLIVSSIVGISMAYLGYGVWALIVSGLVGALTRALMSTLLAGWHPMITTNLSNGSELARYGLFVAGTNILQHLHEKVSTFVLSRTLGPAAIGLFNKGESLARMPHQFITGAVYKVSFRAMAADQDNLDRCRYIFFRSLKLVAVYATPFYIGLVWLAEPLVVGLYGERWAEAAVPLTLLSLAWPLWLVSTMSGAVLAARNWLGREMKIQAITLLWSIGAAVAGVRWGLEGLSVAMISTFLLQAVAMLWVTSRCLKARWRDVIRTFGPAVLLNGILAASLFLVDATLAGLGANQRWAYAIIMSGLGALIYTSAFLLLPIPSLANEQRRWRSIASRPFKKHR